MASFKPTFTISDKQILTKLHEAALRKLNGKLRSQSGVSVELVNSGVGKDVNSSFAERDGIYELACNFTAKNSSFSDADQDFFIDAIAQKKLDHKKSKVVEKAREDAHRNIVDYFTVVCGPERAKKINIDDLETYMTDESTGDDIKFGFKVAYSVGASVK